MGARTGGEEIGPGRLDGETRWGRNLAIWMGRAVGLWGPGLLGKNLKSVAGLLAGLVAA